MGAGELHTAMIRVYRGQPQGVTALRTWQVECTGGVDSPGDVIHAVELATRADKGPARYPCTYMHTHTHARTREGEGAAQAHRPTHSLEKSFKGRGDRAAALLLHAPRDNARGDVHPRSSNTLIHTCNMHMGAACWGTLGGSRRTSIHTSTWPWWCPRRASAGQWAGCRRGCGRRAGRPRRPHSLHLRALGPYPRRTASARAARRRLPPGHPTRRGQRGSGGAARGPLPGMPRRSGAEGWCTRDGGTTGPNAQ